MENQLKEKLYRASARTFEELAFLLPSEKMGDEQAALPLDRGVLVRFSGPFSGRLVLKVSSGLPTALAANMDPRSWDGLAGSATQILPVRSATVCPIRACLPSNSPNARWTI